MAAELYLATDSVNDGHSHHDVTYQLVKFEDLQLHKRKEKLRNHRHITSIFLTFRMTVIYKNDSILFSVRPETWTEPIKLSGKRLLRSESEATECCFPIDYHRSRPLLVIKII